jgi:RNA polymerase sigma-70 factor, ECF subfamily
VAGTSTASVVKAAEAPPSGARPDAALSLSDEEIVKRVLIGNTEAFDTLVVRYQDKVYSLLVRMSGSEEAAEDLAQETFLKAYRALASFRQGSAFYTWLFRIAANTAFTRRRNEGRRRAHEGVSLDADGGQKGDEDGSLKEQVADRKEESPSANLEREGLRERIQQGLSELDENDRAVIVLRDIDGLDYDAIAEVLKISRAAVKSRLHRARLELAKKLKDLKPE